jgi:hypothetical protein
MTDREELSRIDAAIRQRNQTELLWAQEYCRTRIGSAVANFDAAIQQNETELLWEPQYWRTRIRRAVAERNVRRWWNIQRDVGRVLRELGATEDHISAHDWCCENRKSRVESKLCGCFCCLEVFPPNEIEVWFYGTAICPKCSVDSVIGSASGFPIDREFLKKMHDYWC